MPVPTVPLPQASVGEWTAIRTSTAAGLFAYRHLQAVDLLELPDFGGGNLNTEQRREALQTAVNLHKPLAALAIFLGVVGLEDFVRDIGARIADSPCIQLRFAEVSGLRSLPVRRRADRQFKRLDRDPADLIDPEDINELFKRCLGVEPLAMSEFARLRDLALLRHTVAHHAAVIRPIDVPRFQYYIVQPGQTINPPREFVRETLAYLYRTGRTIEEALKSCVFSVVLPTLGAEWWETPPEELLELIELFDYFGNLVEARGPVGYAQPGTQEYERMKSESLRVRDELVQRCINELRTKYAT